MRGDHAFELRVKPTSDGGFRLELREMPGGDSDAKPYRRSTRMSRVSGWHLRLASSAVNNSLREAGYQPSDLKRSRKAPFRFSEEAGVRLDLVFRGLGRLRKRTRIETVLQGISAMSREEALYWHAKVTGHNGATNLGGIRALRMLLGAA